MASKAIRSSLSRDGGSTGTVRSAVCSWLSPEDLLPLPQLRQHLLFLQNLTAHGKFKPAVFAHCRLTDSKPSLRRAFTAT